MLHTARDFLNLDWDAVARQVAEGYISRQVLPGTGLEIYNYTQKTQWAWRWTPETMACRGLITDNGVVVARPFPKFFSAEQLGETPLPFEPFAVHEKLDGSLGILYWAPDGPAIATRGSFLGEQAVVGTRILRERYGDLRFDRRLTYLFEIIYPGNRIVVDYGDRRDLVLLAMIETATGEELSLHNTAFPLKARRYDMTLPDVRAWAEPNAEGFVIRFVSGARVKVKTAEYKRLHRLVTGVNAKTIWECLSAGQSLDDILDRVPDEFYQWVRQTEQGLQAQFSDIVAECRADFRDLGTRKDNALYYQTCRYPAILFKMLDGHPYADVVWKLIKPRGDKPFRVDES